jgi:hypothetical protein
LFERLFEAEEQDLFQDLTQLPRNAALRKLNDLIKRARLAKVHAYIISSLRKDMPSMFGKDSKKKELIKSLDQIYLQLQREHQISPGDFPDIRKMQAELVNYDFSKFQALKPKLIETCDHMLANDIAKLMSKIPMEDVASTEQGTTFVKGGVFSGHQDTTTPFGFKRFEGAEAGRGETDWVVEKERSKYDDIFETLRGSDGKVAGAAAKAEMVKSKLPNTVLAKVCSELYYRFTFVDGA